MKTVLVAGSKGGVGKTTVATHLAAHAALAGRNTALVDLDPQGSSMRWAQRRLQMPSPVLGIDGSGRRAWPDRVPVDTEYVVIDAPAGTMADGLALAIEQAEVLVAPVPPSTLDIEATVTFLDSLAVHPRVRRGQLRVGLVGNKLKPWTQVSQQTVGLLRTWPYPLVAELRDSQAYVLLCALGKSLFDYHSAQVRDHQADWRPLLDWIER
jgi:chromosome partitioning protein